MLACVRDQGCQALDEGEWVEDEVGRTVAPGTTQLVDDLAIGRQREALGRDGGAGDIAAEMLETLAVVGVDVYAGVEGETVLGCAERAGLEDGDVGWRRSITVNRAAGVRGKKRKRRSSAIRVDMAWFSTGRSSRRT